MNLRQLAEADNAFLLEDDVTGFAVEIILTQPVNIAAVKTLLTLDGFGIGSTTVPAGTRWQIGTKFYLQTADFTFDGDGVGTATIEAEIGGNAGDQANGTVATVDGVEENISSALVASTVRAGVNAITEIVHTVKGQYHRIGQEIDPETGLVVAGNRSAVTVRLSSLQNGALPADGWLIETTDITGATVKGKATSVMLDRTAGRATMIMRK